MMQREVLKLRCLLVLLLIQGLCCGLRLKAEVVTLESLLDEMCDADAATRLSESPWTGKLWSSYDRRSVVKDDAADGWFANNDYSQFVATNRIGGRTECVMVDAKGPGALTRLWTANGFGTIYRFYIDGASEPVVTGVGTNLVGGHVLCGAPLADELSASQKPFQRAQDLYLPIPFAKSLVVTAELRDIPPDDDGEKAIRLWYNAEVRTYAEGTPVESFSSNVLLRAQKAIARTNAALRNPPAPETDAARSLDGVLGAHASRTVEFAHEGAIRRFSLKLEGGDESLRNVRVKMAFDGETTVDASVGQLFAAGYAARPFATVDGDVRADGRMTLRAVMPFARSCAVTLTNTADSACVVRESSVAVGAYRWDAARSLHFGAFGFEERELPTRRGAAQYFELNWVELEGKGFLVGNTLATDNSWSDKWWGEGDEKIYLDGESFPSYFGTGTEDFFGYSWGCDTAFTGHPFLALPCSEKPLTRGRRLTTCRRVRRLDRIPFANSLKLDVEVWHWDDCKMHYAPATFWYARPGVKVSREAKRPAAFGDRWRKAGERILFYGDSITHGGRYIADLQLFESLRHPGSRVRFLNGGRSGGSAWTGLKNLDREIAESRPDRIVVMFGMNDIGRDLWKSDAPDATTLARRKKKLSAYRKDMSELVRRIREKNIACVLMTPSPYDQYSDIPVANIPHCNDLGLLAAAQIVRDLAASNHLALIELHEPMTKIFAESKEPLCGDRVHPGEKGNLIMANLIWQAFGEAPVNDPFHSADAEVKAKIKIRNELQRANSEYRNVVLVRRMVEDAKVDPTDFAAADRWLDAWLEGEEKKPYYLGEKAWVDGYRKGRAHERETLAKIETLYGELMRSDHLLPNAARMWTCWNGRNTDWAKLENAEYPVTYVDFVELMAVTGGHAERDCLKNPNDRSVLGDYDFAPLVTICSNALARGMKPYLKLGGVPGKFSDDYDGGSFRVNIRPPSDPLVNYRYMRACASALKEAFGRGEVRQWRFAVLTEANNYHWFKTAQGDAASTREAFYSLYDYTAKAFEEELGEGLTIGIHVVNPVDMETSFEARDFVRRRPLKLLTFSHYYDPGQSPRYTPEKSMEKIEAEVAAIRTMGCTNLVMGFDEGRIIWGRKGALKRDLHARAVGQSYEAAYDVWLARKTYDLGFEYAATWGWFSGPDGWEGIPSHHYFAQREIAKFAGMRRIGRDPVVAVSADGRTVRTMIENFVDRLDWTNAVTRTVKLQLPKDFAGKTVSVATLTLDDRNNWFFDWQADRRRLGIGDGDFDWSSDGFAVLAGRGLNKIEHRRIFAEQLSPRYAEKAKSVVPVESRTRVAEDGSLVVSLFFAGNGAAFVEIRKD